MAGRINSFFRDDFKRVKKAFLDASKVFDSTSEDQLKGVDKADELRQAAINRLDSELRRIASDLHTVRYPKVRGNIIPEKKSLLNRFFKK